MVKLYEPIGNEVSAWMRESPGDGEWIMYDDYASLEARMTGIISGVQLELEDERKKRLAAEARVAELEKDAARYRWLRDSDGINRIPRVFNDGEEMLSVGGWLDADIDILMQMDEA